MHASRWIWTLTLVILCFLCAGPRPVGAWESTEDRLADRYLEAARKVFERPPDRASARIMVENFLAEFPKSNRRDDAIFLLLKCLDPTHVGDRTIARRYLAELAEHRPEQLNHSTVTQALSDFAGVKFNDFPTIIEARKSTALKIALKMPDFDNPGRATHTLYRIPDSHIEQAIADRKPGEEFEQISLGVSRDHWRYMRTQEYTRKSDYRHSYNRSHETQNVTLTLDVPTGVYVIEESIGEIKRVSLIRAVNYVLHVKHLNGDVVAFTLNPFTGKPVGDVDVDLHVNGGKLSTRTGADGIARFTMPVIKQTDEDRANHNHPSVLVTGNRDGEWHHCTLTIYQAREDAVASSIHISTDRPIYRPNQIVHFKAIRRDLDVRTLSMPKADAPAKDGEAKNADAKNAADPKPAKPANKVRVSIKVSNDDIETRTLQTTEHEWNERGTLSGSFQLGAEPILGVYEVVVEVPRSESRGLFRSITLFGDGDEVEEDYWSQPFRVSAYRKPEYAVNIAFDDADAKAADKGRATITAEYYFGGKVQQATVQWSVVAVDQRPDYATWPRVPFEDPLHWYIHEITRRMSDNYHWTDYEDEDHIDSGADVLDDQGRLTIEFPLELKNALASRKYTLHAQVTDLSGLAAESTASFTSGGAALKLVTGVDRMFYLHDDKIRASCRVTTQSGQSAKGVTVKLTALNVPLDHLGKPENEYARLNREIEYESYFAGQVVTDATGLATFELPPGKSGPIRLIYRVADGAGRIVEQRDSLVVEYPGHDEANDPREIKVVSEQAAYREGDTARILIRTWKTPLTAIMTVQGESIHEARIITLTDYNTILELPIKGVFAPNVAVMLSAWDKDRELTLAGGFEFLVYPKARVVDVQVTTDRDSYGPGETAKVTVRTTVDGKPVPAEVELGIVDESIFALMPDLTQDLRTFFIEPTDLWTEYDSSHRFEEYCESIIHASNASFGGSSGGAQSSTTLFSSAPEFDLNSALGPVRQVANVTLDAQAAAATSTRKRFGDTMHWAGHVKTNADGSATVDITTLDNLTTWRITARALSGVNRFGAGTGSTVTTKKVILRLATPRVYRIGDEGTIAGIVHNHLDQPIDCVVKLTATGAKIGNDQPQRITIPAGAERRVTWTIKAESLDGIKLHAQALSVQASDAVEISLPVLSRGIDQFVVKSGPVGETWRHTLTLPAEAQLNSASLELDIAPGSAAAVAGALPFLAKYPYGCVEQTMSRFLPALVAVDAMKTMNIGNAQLERDLPAIVKVGIDRLINFQHEDGGWGWWEHDQSHPAMTAYVVIGLTHARRLGHEVPEGVFVRAKEWLQSDDWRINTRVGQQHQKSHIDVVHALHQLTTVDEMKPILDRVIQQAHDGQMGEVTARTWACLVLMGRVDIAEKLPQQPPAGHGPDDIETASLVLRALIRTEAGDDRIAPFVSYLMNLRRGGRWYSTLDTAHAVFALAAIKQPPAKLNLTVTINGKAVVPVDGRITLPAAALKAGDNEVTITRPKGDTGLLFASAILAYHTDLVEPRQDFIRITRHIERCTGINENGKMWERLISGATVKVNDELRMVVAINSGAKLTHWPRVPIIEAPIPAGTELLELIPRHERPEYGGDHGRREFRDDRFVYLPYENIHVTATCHLRPTMPGTYHIAPAVAYGMYDPDKRGNTAAFTLRIVE